MIILILKIFTLFLACQANSDELDDLVFANNEFGLQLYNKFVETEQGNIIFSPLSISLALAMTSLGARDQTLEEIRGSTFTSGFPEDQIHEQFQKIMKVVPRNDENAQVGIANKLYAQKGFEIISSFLESSQKLYGSELQPVDFSNNKKSASLINNWVSEITNKKITEIVKPDDLTALTRLVLVNALYFKAQWASVFKKHLTKLQTFYATPQNSLKIEFLHDSASRCSYGVNKNLHFEVLEKAFKAREFVFGIILPDLSKTSLDQVVKDLTADALKSLELESIIANITIPKFKFQSSFDLSVNLKKLGINDLFSDRADLSGIEESKSLYVSKAVHKAVVEIDENGAEAAAATAFVISTKSAFIPISPVINFRADHPFLFYIKHVDTGSMLFLGKFIQP